MDTLASSRAFEPGRLKVAFDPNLTQI